MSEPQIIPIDLILRDPRLQSRVDMVEPDVAARYEALYADGPTAMDAIEVYRETGAAGEGQVWLTDGWTRLAAAERAGLREILATVKAGAWRDALLASWEANGRHGARLTRADQRRKAEAIMSDPELAGQPLRALEHRFGVGRELLRTIQAELEAAGRSVRPETITDAAGREQPTKKRGRPPGSKNRPKTAEEAGMRYARELRADVRGLLEDLRDRDVETWDLHGETQEVGLWLEGLDDTSVTELESALPVLRVRASLPGKPAPPAVVQQPTTTPPPAARVETSPSAGDDTEDAAAGEAVPSVEKGKGGAAMTAEEGQRLRQEHRAAHDILARLIDLREGRTPDGWPASFAPQPWPGERLTRWHGRAVTIDIAERPTTDGMPRRWGTALQTLDLDTRDEAERTARLWAWALDLLERFEGAPPQAHVGAPTSIESWRWAIEDLALEDDTVASMIGCEVDVVARLRGRPGAPVMFVADAPQPRQLEGIAEPLQLAALLVGAMADRDVAAITGQPAKVMRELRRRLTLEAGPHAPTADALRATLATTYAPADLAQLAFLLNVAPGDRLVERLALELTERVW